MTRTPNRTRFQATFFAAACLLAAGSPALAQHVGDPQTGNGSGLDPNGAFYAQMNGNVSDQPSCDRKLTSAIRFQQQYELDAAEGETSLFSPSRPRDAIVSLSNTGSGPVDVGLYDEGSRAPQFVTVPAGASQIVEIASLIEVTGTCADPTGRPCTLVLDLKHSNPGGGPVPVTDFWIESPWIGGSATVDPDSWTDCLWESDTIWSSNVPRTIWLKVVNTGNQHLDVEVEYDNNTFATYSTDGSKPMNSGWRLVKTDEYDAVAVRIFCTRNPTVACGPCSYEYQISYEKPITF